MKYFVDTRTRNHSKMPDLDNIVSIVLHPNCKSFKLVTKLV